MSEDRQFRWWPISENGSSALKSSFNAILTWFIPRAPRGRFVIRTWRRMSQAVFLLVLDPFERSAAAFQAGRGWLLGRDA